MNKRLVRHKLMNVAVFFAQNTNHFGKIKLLKLLYLLDFEHYRQTERTVTGLDYYALRIGPVALDVYQEWDDPSPEWVLLTRIAEGKTNTLGDGYDKSRLVFDKDNFTRRELRLMTDLAHRFKDDQTKLTVSITSAELSPWSRIWDNGLGDKDRIPYSLADGGVAVVAAL